MISQRTLSTRKVGVMLAESFSGRQQRSVGEKVDQADYGPSDAESAGDRGRARCINHRISGLGLKICVNTQ